MIWICHPNLLLFWQQWQWYHQERNNSTAGRALTSNCPQKHQQFHWLPPMIISTVHIWQTSSDVGIFYSDEPWRISLAPGPIPPPPPNRKKEEEPWDVLSQNCGSAATYLQSLRESTAGKKRTYLEYQGINWNLKNSEFFVYSIY